jgi:hypothetical protein
MISLKLTGSKNSKPGASLELNCKAGVGSQGPDGRKQKAGGRRQDKFPSPVRRGVETGEGLAHRKPSPHPLPQSILPAGFCDMRSAADFVSDEITIDIQGAVKNSEDIDVPIRFD